MSRPDRIPVKCPNCGTGLRAPLQFAGKRATCRVCKAKVPIPALVENVVADPVIEAEALDEDATELMSVEELPAEYEANPPPNTPPREAVEPDEQEEPKPRARIRVDDEDEDEEKRPRRRPEKQRKRASKGGPPIVLFLVIGGLLFLLAAAGGIYAVYAFTSKPSESTNPDREPDPEAKNGSEIASKPAVVPKPKDNTPLRPIATTKLVGMWSAFDTAGNQWHYSFGKGTSGSLRVIQPGDIVSRPFRCRLFSNGTDYELAIDLDGEAGSARIPISFPAENQLLLSKRHRFNAATQKVEPDPQSVLLTRSE